MRVFAAVLVLVSETRSIDFGSIVMNAVPLLYTKWTPIAPAGVIAKSEYPLTPRDAGHSSCRKGHDFPFLPVVTLLG